MGNAIDILVTGGSGQVGAGLRAVDWPTNVVLHAPTRAQLDLTDPASIRRAFGSRKFDAVINAGAWTAVDKAEAHAADAFLVNGAAPAVLADLTRESRIPLVQISTDYVFNGAKAAPYDETDAVAPLGVYGASKLAGELAVRTGNSRSVVLRTAWVVSASGNNFIKTMLQLARTRPTLQIVDDQQGCPTAARDIAEVLRTVTMRLVSDPQAPTGIFHFVNAGATTWAGLAREVFAHSARLGGPVADVAGISTSDYPTAAARPANSRLSTSKLANAYGLEARPWRTAVSEIVSDLLTNGTVQ